MRCCVRLARNLSVGPFDNLGIFKTFKRRIEGGTRRDEMFPFLVSRKNTPSLFTTEGQLCNRLRKQVGSTTEKHTGYPISRCSLDITNLGGVWFSITRNNFVTNDPGKEAVPVPDPNASSDVCRFNHETLTGRNWASSCLDRFLKATDPVEPRLSAPTFGGHWPTGLVRRRMGYFWNEGQL
ncbi:hypothetical protein BJ508DRAFT_150543 [Ascobolus immersus RN42]|uniref:Uncharacterized protein n=1 Tax=Ascobolus immersus RN42 TaxID=1160509 RepID=A0A3N4I469_ASCIM|nr:hypothetical protein BJ508DRAFT_150543 [Ascobolus immersus RN42]